MGTNSPLPVETKKLRAFLECCDRESGLRNTIVQWIRATIPDQLLDTLGGADILDDMTEEALQIEDMPADYRVNRPKGRTMIERRQNFLETQRRRIAGRTDIRRMRKKELNAKIDAALNDLI